MFLAENWKDYEILDSKNLEKLEIWGDYILRRPEPQAIWESEKYKKQWNNPNGHYFYDKSGKGKWKFNNLPKEWEIEYMLSGYPILEELSKEERTMRFHLKPFKFKHTGLFPEQAANWDFISSSILKERKRRESLGIKREIKVLNLFAYTGGATLAALKAGASVTHVDSSKSTIEWAKENAELSGLKDSSVRWLHDDCIKFVEREIRRGNFYDAIIMDPPSFGRGPKGEIWKIEDSLYHLLDITSKIMNEESIFMLINSYTTGLQPGVVSYITGLTIMKKLGGKLDNDEIGIPVKSTGLVLPCGSCARWTKDL